MKGMITLNRIYSPQGKKSEFKALPPAPPAQVSKRTGDGSYTFVISSGAVDSQNETINPHGWDFSRFKSNPVVLHSHEASMFPIGRAHDVWVGNDGKVRAKMTFAPRSTKCRAMPSPSPAAEPVTMAVLPAME